MNTGYVGSVRNKYTSLFVSYVELVHKTLDIVEGIKFHCHENKPTQNLPDFKKTILCEIFKKFCKNHRIEYLYTRSIINIVNKSNAVIQVALRDIS